MLQGQLAKSSDKSAANKQNLINSIGVWRSLVCDNRNHPTGCTVNRIDAVSRYIENARPYGKRCALPNISVWWQKGLHNKTKFNNSIGVWRSLVARLTGGQEAMGSSPVTPTTNFAECIHCVHSVFYIRSTCACANVETDIKTSTLCVPKFVTWN